MCVTCRPFFDLVNCVVDNKDLIINIDMFSYKNYKFEMFLMHAGHHLHGVIGMRIKEFIIIHY